MKPIIAACCLAAFCALNLSAQTREIETKSKTTVKDGKEVTVTGCVARAEDARSQYMLTNVADKGGAVHSYLLVSDSDDFSKLIGQRVQIEGTVADSHHGKVEIKTETKVDGPGKDTHSKVEGKGPYLGVKHVKKIAASCP